MIDLGIRSDQLYIAVKLEIEFARSDASSKSVSGTGFVVVDQDQPLAVVATSRHLLDPTFSPKGTNRPQEYGLQLHSVRGRAWRRVNGGMERFVWRIDSPRVLFHSEPHLDVALLDLNDLSVESGTNTLEFFLKREMLASRVEFDGLEVSAGDMLAVIGYPKVSGTPTEAPILIPGVLSSDPRISEPLPGFDADIVAYHAFSRSGLSGSPVLAPARGMKVNGDVSFETKDARGPRVVGVNSAHLNQDSSEPMPLSYFCPSWAILDIIDGERA